MFEDLGALAERLLATAPDQTDAGFEPVLDPDGALLDRVVAARTGEGRRGRSSR